MLFVFLLFTHVICTSHFFQLRHGDGKMASTSLVVSPPNIHALSLSPFACSPRCCFIAGFDLVFSSLYIL